MVGAVVVAQLVAQLLLAPEARGLNPVIIFTEYVALAPNPLPPVRVCINQCDQIWQNSTTSAILLRALAKIA